MKVSILESMEELPMAERERYFSTGRICIRKLLSDGKGSVPLQIVPFDLSSAFTPILISGLRNTTEYAVYTIITEKDGQSSDIYFPAVALFTTGPCVPLKSTYPKLVVQRDDEVRIVFEANEQNLCPLNVTVKIESRTVVTLSPGVFTFKTSNKAVVALNANDGAKEILLHVPKFKVTHQAFSVCSGARSVYRTAEMIFSMAMPIAIAFNLLGTI